MMLQIVHLPQLKDSTFGFTWASFAIKASDFNSSKDNSELTISSFINNSTDSIFKVIKNLCSNSTITVTASPRKH